MTPLLHGSHVFNLQAWHFEPTVIAGTFIVVSFYAYGLMSIREAFVPWKALAFLLGVTLMFLSLASPLDVGADRLLSLHMLQHVFLTTIGPPLVLLGLPDAMLRPVFSNPSALRAGKLLFHPVTTGAIFIVNMWFWHVPPVYDLAVTNLEVHVVMHFAFMGSGLLFWWPVIQPSSLLPRVGDGARLLYLFATGMPMALLAMLFFASNGVIYDYYEQPDWLWGISPMDDQQIAGLVMGALGEAASFAAITLLFFRFLDREEAEAEARTQGRADVV
jgi:putative membrane protein